jgi:hypothetical protein
MNDGNIAECLVKIFHVDYNNTVYVRQSEIMTEQFHAESTLLQLHYYTIGLFLHSALEKVEKSVVLRGKRM